MNHMNPIHTLQTHFLQYILILFFALRLGLIGVLLPEGFISLVMFSANLSKPGT
jgi:hypothetical protein